MLTKLPTYQLKDAVCETGAQEDLDLNSILYYRHWYLFEDDTRVYDMNFSVNDEFSFTHGGIVYHGSWQTAPHNEVLLSFKSHDYITQALYLDDSLLILKEKHTQNLLILLAQSAVTARKLLTLSSLEKYLEHEVEFTEQSATYELQPNKDLQELNNILQIPNQSTTKKNKNVGDWPIWFKIIGCILLAFFIVISIVAMYKAGVGTTILFIVIALLGFVAIGSLPSNDKGGSVILILSLIWVLYLIYEICDFVFV